MWPTIALIIVSLLVVGLIIFHNGVDRKSAKDGALVVIWAIVVIVVIVVLGIITSHIASHHPIDNLNNKAKQAVGSTLKWVDEAKEQAKQNNK